jgi:hypothetical protein
LPHACRTEDDELDNLPQARHLRGNRSATRRYDRQQAYRLALIKICALIKVYSTIIAGIFLSAIFKLINTITMNKQFSETQKQDPGKNEHQADNFERSINLSLHEMILVREMNYLMMLSEWKINLFAKQL